MKKTTYVNYSIFAILLLLGVQLVAQNYVPFTPRFDQDLKGDIVLIGNNILGPDNNAFNDNSVYNHNVDMRYIDIDGDPTTFSSSSADLVIPNPGCYRIIYAGLYWGAVTNGTESITDVKLRGPSGGYTDVTGNVIFEANGTSVDGGDSFSYACYADVTSIVTSLATDLGTYTIANVSSAQGETSTFSPYNGTGYSAGWSLFIVYEDPTVPGKSITSFDGFSAISVPGSNPNLDIPVSGFRTVPAPAPVRANFAFATLEGDKPILGDRLLLNGTRLSAADRLETNFFNSSVTQLSALPVNNRNPNSTNTLGFDTGVMVVPNPGNTVIANDDTSATVRLETSGDTFFPYFFALAVDIIEPNIVLTKIVEDISGNNIGGQVVNLGDELNYIIGFQNTGNDNATDFTIRDVLPTNIVFNYPADIVSLPAGVTVDSYDPISREIVFRVDDSVVEEFDPVLEIRFRVTVVANCSLLDDACSNIINNQAYATYNGTLNPTFTISDDPSINNNTGCLLTPGATNFLSDLNCQFREDVILCGDTVELRAGDGYDAYTWSSDPSGTPIIGTGQTLTVNAVGTYYVHNEATAPCQSIDQIFDVITYGAGVTNPVIPFADQVVVCPNDGKELPNFFLCGANDFRFIQTGITDTSSMIWERLDETSCSAVLNQDCANEDTACSWNQVGTGPDYMIDTAGQYRLTLNYTGGCFNQYYFNVYENVLVPTVTSRDIICTTPGEIVIGSVPSGYEYSLDGVNFQASNTFSVTTAGIYAAYVRQIGVSPNPCIFEVPDIQIRDRDFTVSTTVNQPLCYGDLGSVVLAANDVRPQYYFSIYQGATLVNSVGPITPNNYTFSNLNPGTYTVNISTDDGCAYTGDINIIEPPQLMATAAITRPLTCTNGEITIYPNGGTAPYFYFVNSTTVFQTVPTIDVSSAGTYNITVVDSNNCSTDVTIDIDAINPPVFNMTTTDILCYGDDDGEIVFNVTNANGYTIEYSIDNGATFLPNPTFSNLAAGTYQTQIRYSIGAEECFTTIQDIDITQPDYAVTASAGVSELAGCGPSGEGRLRITNPQGGVPPYEYSFDNQATWTTTNEAYVMPGSYTLYIRDANGCIFGMPDLILDPEPVPPTLVINDPDYNCDGTASSTVTVTNTGGASFDYTYILDGIENPNTADPTTFLNVPDGSHVITVQYSLLNVPTFSNLLIEDFGTGGDVESPGINPAFCFERQVEATKCNGDRRLGNGEYTVTNRLKHNIYGGWHNPVDHTSADPNGRYLAVDAGAVIPNNAVLYRMPINNIIPNQPIRVSFYATNLLRVGNTQPDASLTVEVVDGSGTALSSQSTGGIPKTNGWVEYNLELNPGNNTNLDFVLRLEVSQVNGIDFAVDDIRVFQLPVSCTSEVDLPFVIDPGNAFTAQITQSTDVTCSGASDGTVTIDVENFDPVNGYEYSLDGTNWNTATTSPLVITGLSDGSHTIQVRYDNTNTCNFSFNQVIDTPTALTVVATATDVTCLADATVTATGSGGTMPYSYELLDAATSTLVNNFPSNGILTNVAPGDYIVRITDINNCQSDSSVLTIIAPTSPTATIDVTSDYCYNTSTGATLVVNASSGTPPYEYSINGGPFVTNNTFGGLLPGSYDITVRDSYGCTFTLPTETIANQLSASTILTKDLDCTVSPDAIITSNITGGVAPYSYTVSYNSGAFGASTAIVGTSFTYTTPNDGTYQFEITDALGCTVLSAVMTVNAISLPEITSVVQTQDILCVGDNNAAINVTINNAVGTPPFTVNVNNDTTGTDYGTQTAGLPAGTYTITLTDSKSCTDTETITILEPTVINPVTSTVPITCQDDGSGTGTNVTFGSVIVNSVTGGTAPYTYHVTGTNGYSAFENNATGSTSVTFDVVDFGSYTLTVTDSNGCSVLVTNLQVAAPPDDLDIIVNAPPADCSTGGSANVSVGTSGGSSVTGSGPFYFAIYTGVGMVWDGIVGGSATWQLGAGAPAGTTFNNLIPGATYTFIIYDDDTGCYYYETSTLPIPTNSTLSTGALVANNITCTGSADGNVSFDITDTSYGIATPVTYEIFNSLSLTTTLITGSGTVPANGTLSVSNLGPLPVGSYTVVVTEDTGATNAGCSVATTSFNINESAIALSLTAQIDNNANCNPNSGLISAVAQGGTAPYEYQITTSSTAPAVADPSWASANTFNVNANTYYVHVKDAYNCIRTTSAIILPTDPEPVIAASVSNQCTVTEGNFEIDVTLTTAGVAPYSFSIDGGAFLTRTAPFTISNLSSGTHTIQVQDANGCGNLISVTIEAPLDLIADITALPSCTNNDGEITVTGSGGTGTYAYSISPNAGITLTGNVFTDVPSGTYTVTITDTATSCSTDTSVTIDAATPVTFTDVTENTSCNGASDGMITINLPATNDNPVYTYEITAGPLVRASQSSNVFADLPAGTYTVLVTSGRNCFLSQDITVGEPNPIVVSAPTVVEYACNAGVNSVNLATITVAGVTGGSSTYTNYEFIRGGTTVQSDSSNVYNEADLAGGTYTINVYDDNGCVGTTTATIQPFISIETINVTVDTPITCTNDEDITVTVTSTGGTPTNLDFIVEDTDGTNVGLNFSQTNNTGVFTGLPIGNYLITVTNLDTSCTLQAVHTVLDPNTFDLQIDSVVNVTCFNDNDGSVNVTFIDRAPTPTDESGAFSYTVTDVLGATVASGTTTDAGPLSIGGLVSGTYTITASLINVPFCTVSRNFTIQAPTEILQISETHTEITCAIGNNDGTISASATGGWPGTYEYQLELGGTIISSYSAISNFTDLVAGNYDVRVRDSQGCVVSIAVNLVNPIPLTGVIDPILPLSCFGDDNATITVSGVSGGQGSNYTYTLSQTLPTVSSSGPQSSNVFSNLSAGTYNVTISDGYNCEFTTGDVVITQPTELQASLVKATSQTCTTDATLTLSATGGTGTYEYSTTANFAAVIGTFSSSTTFSVTPGDYMYYVRDANGCVSSVSNQITIETLPTLTLELDTSNAKVNCAGDTTGVIVAVAEGGIGSYVYTLQDTSGNAIPATQNSPGVFTELAIGDYQVRVDSGDCLFTSATINISQPNLPLEVNFSVSDVTCNGENNGILEIVATGGTGIIKYAISPQMNQFFDDPIFEDLAPGNYQAIAQDELGCFEVFDFTVNEPLPVIITIVPNSLIPELCEGDMNGEFSIDISGGTLPYSVALDDINGTYTTGTPAQTIFDFTSLAGGDHLVYIRDAEGCESEWNITFPESVLLDPEVRVEYCTDVADASSNSVTVTIDDSIDSAEVDYSLDGVNFQASNIFIDVAPGANQAITVRHSNGCEQLVMFDINQYQPLQIALNNGQGINEIEAQASGGSGNYEYAVQRVNETSFEPYQDTGTFIIYESGEYTVTVTDSNGCVATETRYFEFIDVCVTNYFVPANGGWGPGCTSQYRDMTFDIFDRYGRKIATLGVDDKWDGTYNGKELPTGDYWYVVKLNDVRNDRSFVGHFTLYR